MSYLEGPGTKIKLKYKIVWFYTAASEKQIKRDTNFEYSETWKLSYFCKIKEQHWINLI